MTNEEQQERFRELHATGCFVLPNPWDIGSAKYLQHLGFAALATTSGGFAFSRGLPDGEVGRDDMLAHIRDLVAATDLPLNADFGNGFATEPEGVADNVRLCASTGIAGLSIEDLTGDTERPLYELPLAVERVKAARSALDTAAPGVLLVARSECFLVGHPDPLNEALKRLAAFADAGADVLYAPGLKTPGQIEAIVSAMAPKPVNVLVGANTGLTIRQLRDLGVRRVSVGSAFARAAWGGFIKIAREVAESGTFTALDDAAPFADLDRFFAERR